MEVEVEVEGPSQIDNLYILHTLLSSRKKTQKDNIYLASLAGVYLCFPLESIRSTEHNQGNHRQTGLLQHIFNLHRRFMGKFGIQKLGPTFFQDNKYKDQKYLWNKTFFGTNIFFQHHNFIQDQKFSGPILISDQHFFGDQKYFIYTTKFFFGTAFFGTNKICY